MHNSREWVEGGMREGGWGRDFEYEVEAESGTRTTANAERLFCIDKLTQQPRVDCLPLLPWPGKAFEYFYFTFNSSLSLSFTHSPSAALTHHHKNASIKCAVRMPAQLPHLPHLPALGHGFYQTVKII